MDRDLPNFLIPHAEKIEWMIENAGWAIESIDPGSQATEEGVPLPPYSYTINFDEFLTFPNVVVCGLTPVACRGLFDMVVDIVSTMTTAGQEIEIGADLLGLFDGEQRARFVHVDMSKWGSLFGTATAWYRTNEVSIVQLLWPDRNGFLPGEAGFDQKLRFAQPLLT